MPLRNGVLCLLTLLVVYPHEAVAQRAVYLVRHAEKQDDSLTTTGQAQAQKLARLLEKSGITTVYTSQFERTKLTAAPLVTRLATQGITAKTEVLPLGQDLLHTPNDPALLKAYAESVTNKLRSESAQEIVLFVGHDITVPAIIKAFGYPSDITIQPTEFDHLFLVIPRSGHGTPPGFFHLPHYAE